VLEIFRETFSSCVAHDHIDFFRSVVEVGAADHGASAIFGAALSARPEHRRRDFQ
jgi:hypothetical protein